MQEDIEGLHRAVTALMQALKIAEKNVQVAHRELNFVAADIATLRYLTGHPDCMLSDLASHLGVVPTTASSVVARLVERGFVSRERPEANRRSIALRMTPDGQHAFALIDAEVVHEIRRQQDERHAGSSARSGSRALRKIDDAHRRKRLESRLEAGSGGSQRQVARLGEQNHLLEIYEAEVDVEYRGYLSRV